MLYEQHSSLPAEYVRGRVAAFLEEDLPDGDVTSRSIFRDHKVTDADFIAVESQVFAGAELLRNGYPESCTVELNIDDGSVVNAGEIMAQVSGPVTILLEYERVMLNLLQRLCGIATNVQRYTALATPKGVKILDTRKTTPGLRLFEKYAVICGGGTNHRLDLSSGILIKDNHLQAAGGVTAAVENVRDQGSGLPIELEVDNLDQIEEGLTQKVDGFLLDNMDPDLTKIAVARIRSHPNGKTVFIESSGGITLNTLPAYLNTGIDAVSVGAITHSARATDIRLEFTK